MPEPPQVQVGDLIAFALDGAPEVVLHAGVAADVEKDRARVAAVVDERKRRSKPMVEGPRLRSRGATS
jgi:hypothetical protein